jgi:peroxiredoxin
MSKSTRASIIGIVLTVACAVLIFLDLRVIAACVGVGAFFMTALGVKDGATKWKAAVSFVTAAIFGYAMCPQNGFFCMVAAMVLFISVMSLRLLFFEQLAYFKLSWIEPLFFAAGIGYYVFGNIYDGSGWVSWALPTPSMALVTFMMVSRVKVTRELKANAIDKFAVNIGRPAPDFELPDQDGNLVRLSDYKGKRHVLLIFVRGDWCPTCHIMLRSYEKNKEKFAEKNIMLLAIGPDNVGVNKAMMEKLSVDYKILSDEKLVAARSYGMQIHSNAGGTNYAEGIPLPASFLVDVNGNVIYTSNPRNAGEILNPETIIPVVDKLHAPALV